MSLIGNFGFNGNFRKTFRLSQVKQSVIISEITQVTESHDDYQMRVDNHIIAGMNIKSVRQKMSSYSFFNMMFANLEYILERVKENLINMCYVYIHESHDILKKTFEYLRFFSKIQCWRGSKKGGGGGGDLKLLEILHVYSHNKLVHKHKSQRQTGICNSMVGVGLQLSNSPLYPPMQSISIYKC